MVYDSHISHILLRQQWIFYCAAVAFLVTSQSAIARCLFEQCQKKLRRKPLMALWGTSAMLMPFVSRLCSDPWCFSAIWTNFVIVVEAPASEMGVSHSSNLRIIFNKKYCTLHLHMTHVYHNMKHQDPSKITFTSFTTTWNIGIQLKSHLHVVQLYVICWGTFASTFHFLHMRKFLVCDFCIYAINSCILLLLFLWFVCW